MGNKIASQTRALYNKIHNKQLKYKESLKKLKEINYNFFFKKKNYNINFKS